MSDDLSQGLVEENFNLAVEMESEWLASWLRNSIESRYVRKRWTALVDPRFLPRQSVSTPNQVHPSVVCVAGILSHLAGARGGSSN